MTDRLKEIIENATPLTSGIFDEFLIVTTGEKYDGFWGENGFDKIILLAKKKQEQTYSILTDYSDVFMLQDVPCITIDIPSELNCVRANLSKPIQIHDVTSSVIGYGKERL